MLGDVTAPPKYVPMEQLRSRYYIRLEVVDRPGVMAMVTKVFGDRQISLKAVTQHESAAAASDGSAMVVVLTDVALEGHLQAALKEISSLDIVREAPVMIRVVEEHEEYPT